MAPQSSDVPTRGRFVNSHPKQLMRPFHSSHATPQSALTTYRSTPHNYHHKDYRGASFRDRHPTYQQGPQPLKHLGSNHGQSCSRTEVPTMFTPATVSEQGNPEFSETKFSPLFVRPLGDRSQLQRRSAHWKKEVIQRGRVRQRVSSLCRC